MITQEQKEQIINKVFVRGKLRASKPKLKEETKFVDGCACYVWRMASFMVSNNSKLWCMPVTADFDIPEANYSVRKSIAKELDILVDAIVNMTPPAERHGVNRWARAYGVGR
jgi:hypothetical protein